MRGAALTQYAEVAAEVGLDAKAMLRSVGIDRRALSEGEMRIPAHLVVELLEQSARASGCETFGLRMAEHRQLADYGPISLLLAHQPSMRDVVMTLIRYQRMLNEALLIHIEDHRDEVVVVREEIVTGVPQQARQAYELAVGTLVRIFRGGVGPQLKPLSVDFIHPAPSDLSLHRRVFGPIVQFNSGFNGVACRRDDFDGPSPTADPALVRHAEQLIDALPYATEISLAGEVQKAIQVLLPFNGASMAAVADRLGYSERTLQRRLADEGAEFSRLLNEIRRDHALRYLGNQRVSLAEVAGLVGYGHETSFARWFAGEFGMTPSAWRTSPR